MPVLAMADAALDHQKRFQTAVDVIHNLPKSGSYRPSYEVMLRFYGLYKQAVCGPCQIPRPGFWDPVGRYKWDAWSRLGEMSREAAMAAYVEEMKKVAQEVIDTVPMNEASAALFHHFEPLYRVIHDMPRPPASLVPPTEDPLSSTRLSDEAADRAGSSGQNQNLDPPDLVELTADMVNEAGPSEGFALTSDSESEVFCDSVDSVEQLTATKVLLVTANGHHAGRSDPDEQLDRAPEGRQVGAGRGGEGAEGGKCPGRGWRSRDGRQEGSRSGWREGGAPQGGVRRGPPGGGAGRDGGDGSEGGDGAERPLDLHLEQQIVVALQRLRLDMHSVMERLEAVERLAASQAQGTEWRTCARCAAAVASEQDECWWPLDASPLTVLLLLLWPFVAQGLVHLLRRAHHRGRSSP